MPSSAWKKKKKEKEEKKKEKKQKKTQKKKKKSNENVGESEKRWDRTNNVRRAQYAGYHKPSWAQATEMTMMNVRDGSRESKIL